MPADSITAIIIKMNIRELKKELKQKGLNIKSLLNMWDEIQQGKYLSSQPSGGFAFPSNKAYIYKSEMEYISRWILDYKDIETGGQLFGYWTAGGSPVVVYAIGPGEKANHQVAFFNQDIDYLTSVGNLLVRHYGLHHIGEWHSHHKLGLAKPSGHDASTMVETIRQKNLNKFLLCIGNCTDKESSFNPFNFTQDCGYDYVESEWLMYDIESPYRRIIDNDLKRYIIDPISERPNYNTRNIRYLTSYRNDRTSGYWFEDKNNRLILKNIIESLQNKAEVVQCFVQLDDNQHVHLQVAFKNGIGEHIYFPLGFPQDPPSISSDSFIETAPWHYNGDILSSFIKYYNSNHYDGRKKTFS